MLVIENDQYIIHAILTLLCFLVLGICVVYRKMFIYKKHDLLKQSARGVVSHGFQLFCAIVAFGSVLLVLLSPRLEVTEDVPIKHGMEVVAAIDCSKSMSASISERDTMPRFTLVKQSVDELFRSMPSDSKGIICFSSKVQAQTKLSTDYTRDVQPELKRLTWQFVDQYGYGTDFSKALEGCLGLFNKDVPTRKICIILSDGERQGSLRDSMERFSQSIREFEAEVTKHRLDVGFYLVGVGVALRPVYIPKRDSEGRITGLYSDPETKRPARSHPDPQFLKHVAGAFGGKFIFVWKSDQLRQALSKLIKAERATLGSKTVTVRKDFTNWIFILTAICLIGMYVSPIIKRRRVHKKKK